MSTKPVAIQGRKFTDSDRLFLDANVWMLIYGPTKPTDKRLPVYSGAFSQMLTAKSCLFIDALIVSEFVNRFARLRHETLKPLGASKDFKQFRKSVDFTPVATDICNAVNKILGTCSKTESEFEACDMKRALVSFEKGAVDFNDFVVAELCNKRGWIFVTDDSDFKTIDVQMITGNKYLLT